MTLNIPIPMTSQAFYSPAQMKSNVAVTDAFAARNGELLQLISDSCKVPMDLILGFMFVESECKNAKPRSSRGAVGYMQIDPATATEVIWREKKNGRLGETEKEIILRHIGPARFAAIIRSQPTRGMVTQAELGSMELNILLGTMYLGQLIDAHTEGNLVRLDKVIIRYNRGYYSKPTGATVEAIIANAKSRWGTIPADYVRKLVGRNGLLEAFMKYS